MFRPVLLASLVVGLAVVGTADASPARTATGQYAAPASSGPTVRVAGQSVGGRPPRTTVVGHEIGGVIFPLVATDRSVQVHLEDASGQPVGAAVYEAVKDGSVSLGSFCATSKSLRLRRGGSAIYVYPSAGGCGAPAISGTVTATFR